MNGWKHPMEVCPVVDTTRPNQVNDNVAIKGEFEWFKHHNKLPNDCWLKFEIDRFCLRAYKHLVFEVTLVSGYGC